jgi:ParB/RepB/Spo0J family partition protein
MVKVKKAPSATEPDVLPAPAPAPLQAEPALPWLDCDGNVLLEGDKANVLPDISIRLSGKLVTIVGNYDAASRSLEVEVHEDEPNLNNPRILPHYLKLLPVLGDNLGQPSEAPAPVAAAVDAVAISMDAWELLDKLVFLGEAPVANVSTDAAPLIEELFREKLIEYVDDTAAAYRATALGQAAAAPEPAASEAATPAPEVVPAPVYTPTKMKLVPLADIVVTSNTRKVFDETALAELAESIKAQGVIAPITVRPHAGQPGKFELVAGERRYRASKLAEQVTIPAVIRTLTDREFLEVQLLENLQRVDVRPADEAQAFSKLMQNDFSAEEVALKVGKPVKFVLQRAKLVALIPFWFELLESEKLALVAAHELARLPAHSQLAVKHEVEKYPGHYEKGYSKSDIRDVINEKVLRKLDKAPWDKADALLVPSAGPCTLCPKRSAAQGVLFEMKEGVDLCLDASCFSAKRAAFVSRRLAELTAELGKAPLQASSSYTLDGNQKDAGIIASRDWYQSTEGVTGAVPVLMVDGAEAGQIKYVRITRTGVGGADTSPEAKAAARENRESAMRTNRISRTKNELWAGMLRDLLRNQLTGQGKTADGAIAMVDFFLREQLLWGRSRTTNDTLAYLHEQYSWEKATEADLNATWGSHGARTYEESPHRQYLDREMARMTLLDKLTLYFDLKFIRDGLENAEISNRQNALVKLLPLGYRDEFDITTKAEKLVQERYYSKGKKKEATA